MRVYTAISLSICGRKFPYIQKSFFAYAEIYFRIYRNFAAHIRKFPSAYKVLLPGLSAPRLEELPIPPQRGEAVGVGRECEDRAVVPFGEAHGVHRAALDTAFDDKKLGAEGGLQAVTSDEAVRVDGRSQRIFGEHKSTRGDDPILECLMCLGVCTVKARGDDGDGTPCRFECPVVGCGVAPIGQAA